MPVSQVHAHFRIFLVFLLLFISNANAETIYVFGNSSANKDITTNNVPSPWTYGVDLGDIQVYFKDKISSSKAVQFQIQYNGNNKSINYQLQDANTSTAIISGDSIVYPQVFNYTNITYRIRPNHLVKTITISNESAPTNFTFKFQLSGVTHYVHSDGAITFYSNDSGERLFAIKKPEGYDSNSAPRAIKINQYVRQAGPNFFLDIYVNETNMSSFTYPIYVDPTTGICGTLDNSTHEYILSANISSVVGTCFTIAANNVTLNGNGNSISGDRSGVDYGVNIGAYQNATIKNLIVYNFDSGVLVSGGVGINITTNTFHNNTNGGIIISQSSNTFVSNNTAYKNSHGFIISSSLDNTLTSNIAYNQSSNGFTLSSTSVNNTLYRNTAYNNSEVGIALDNSSNSNISNNIVYNNRLHGFLLQNGANNNVLISNFAYNNSQYGFVLNAVTGINLSQNNATNNLLAQYQFLQAANATFTGSNRVFQTPSAALDLNISGGSNVTTLVGSTYNNFTSENLTIFFHNAINVSIKFMTNNSAGAVNSLCSSSDPESCNLVNFNGFNTILNISNTSGSATIDLGIYFNVSEFNDTIERTTVKIGKYNNGWLEVGRTVYDGTIGSVRLDGITSFSLFGAVAFKTKPNPVSTDASSSSSSTTVSYSQTENSVEIVADSEGNPVSNVVVRVILDTPYGGVVEEKTTDENGKVAFDLSQKGSYKIDFTRPGHPKPDSITFDFNPTVPETSERNDMIKVAPEPPVKPISELVELSPEPETESVPVVYDLLESGDAKLGGDYLVKAIKDSNPCRLCEATIKYPNGEETQFKTNARGEIRVALLFAGQYDVSLLDDKGLVVEKRSITVDAEPPFIKEDIDGLKQIKGEKPKKLDLLQLSLILVAVSLIAVLIYNIFRK